MIRRAALPFLISCLALFLGPAPSAPVASPLCPAGYESTPDTGWGGGPGCRPLHEVESPAELLAAAQASSGPRAGLTADDRLAAVARAREMRATAEARRARTGSAHFSTTAGAPVPDSATRWQTVGPLPIHADDPMYGPSTLGWTTLSGRITAVAVDRTDPSGSTVYVGAAAGGVWKSTDAGDSWVPVGDALPTLAIGAVAVHPQTGWVYVGTGESNTSTDAYMGAGTWRSKNAGTTWDRLPTVPNDAVTSHIDLAGDFVYVATSQGLYRSANRGDTVTRVDLPTGGDAALQNFVTDVRVRPGVTGHTDVTAAVGWRSGKVDGEGLYQSSDAGLTFTAVNSPTFGAASPSSDPIGRISLAYAPPPSSGPSSTLWAVVQDPGKTNLENNPIALTTPAQVPPTALNGVYWSNDNGATWTLKGSYEIYQSPVTNPGSALIGALTPTYGPGIQAWYNQYVAVDPTDADRVIVGLEEIYETVANANTPGAPAEWHTAGRYWDSCSGLTLPQGNCPSVPEVYGEEPGTTHPDQHAADFAVLPDGTSRIYVGGDGGVYRQDEADRGPLGYRSASWVSLNDGLNTTQPYAAAMSADGTVYSGMQDNGTVKTTPDLRSDMVFGGDGFDVAVDPEDANLAFGETPNGAMRKTANGGDTWTIVTPSGASRARFNTPFEMDRTDSEHIVYVAGQVFETQAGFAVTSGGWTNVFDMAIADSVPNAQGTAVDVRGTAVYVAYCGTPTSAPAGSSACNITTTEGGDYDPEIFTSGLVTNVQAGCERETGSSECWEHVAAQGLPNRYIQGLAIDPQDPMTVYAAVASHSRRWTVHRPTMTTGNVFKSTDGGRTFVDISGTGPDALPDILAADILVQGGRLIVATDAGVFATSSTTSTDWVPLGTGLPPVPGYDLSLNPQGTRLVLATHGRGVRYLPLGAVAPTSPPPTLRPTPVPTSPRPRAGVPLPSTGLPGWVLVAPGVVGVALLLRRRLRPGRTHA